ncbi:hypothetical protein [Nitrosomonas sp. sh817]|uniref:hypothetical protein n=1 Tax=Nitrosomonas sp. sh817 TaxID=3070658 RepID=UPI0027DD62EA|nr:hypothetical protein [Nitrosomonas sp. sh817]WMJ09793.1 hypothetical protein RBH92_06250 [Nitrosomonas sp. sh817]
MEHAANKIKMIFRQVIPERSDPAVFLRNVMETVIVGNVTNCRAAICRINNLKNSRCNLKKQVSAEQVEDIF